MKIPKLSLPRKARRVISMVTVAVMILGFAYLVYGVINIHVDGGSTVNHASTSAALNSAVISYPAGNSSTPPPCTVTSTTTATCGTTIQLTVNGSGTEAGNYTITVTFTASPAGSQVTAVCTTTGADSCTVLPPNPVFATGSSQTISVLVKATGAGSGSVSVTLTG